MRMGKPKRLGDRVIGTCVDCNKPFQARDEYIVRGEIWRESGMGPWDAGRLHRQCLEARIGRTLTTDDLLVVCIGETRRGIEMRVSPDYLTSPEFLNH